MKIALVVYSNEPEVIWNAFRLGTTSLTYDNEVTVFLLGSGVEAPTLGTLKFDVQEQLTLFRQEGGNLIGCGVCCEIRRDNMPLLEEQLDCEIGSMQTLYGLIAEADKIITF